jgi:predicted transcriptional regulator
MTTKEIAKKVIDTLPDEADMDTIIYTLYIKSKFEQGEREIEEGRGIPHEEVKKRLFEKWVK